LPSSADCSRVFFSSSALYMEMVTIFDEPGLEDLALLVFFFNWKQWTQICSLHHPTYWSCRCSWSGGRWFMRDDSWKIRRCYCRQIGRIGSV
jgi:hypothetical protein